MRSTERIVAVAGLDQWASGVSISLEERALVAAARSAVDAVILMKSWRSVLCWLRSAHPQGIQDN